MKKDKLIIKAFLCTTLFGLYSFLCTDLKAQVQTSKTGWGAKFASNYNHFFKANITPLINGSYTSAIGGLFAKTYYANGVLEIGLNYNYKGLRDEFSLPLVTRNFKEHENLAQSAIEFDFKVGPRIWYFYPKFGLTAGYFFRQVGFTEPNSEPVTLNQPYAILPIGLSLDLPTSFGSTGVAFYYGIGLSNVFKAQDWDSGGKIRYLNFELHVMVWANRD